MPTPRATIAALLAAALPLACAAPPPPPVPSAGGLAPPAVERFDTPAWTATAEGDPVVATVDGAPIPSSLVLAAARRDPDRPAADLLERLIEMEVLAQEAERRGLNTAPAVVRTWREALAQRELEVGFEQELRPEDIPLAEVERIYWLPDIRKIYDHHDAWRMAHLFFTCCDPKVEACDTPDVLACFEDGAREIQEVYAGVKARARDVEGDPDKVMEVMKDYRRDMEERWPQLAYRDRGFFYDPKKPYAEQKGYDILAEDVALTVINAPLAVLQEPIQSPFGWHILVKLDHVPEKRLGPRDPEVVADIRKNAFPAWQRARFADMVARLRAAWKVETSPERLEALTAARTAGEPPEVP